MNTPRANFRRGFSMVYIIVVMVAVMAIGSMAVDFGRVQVAKTQLRVAADAGARAGVTALGSVTAVQTLAGQLVAANTCDGALITFDPTTGVEFLNWDAATRTYTVLSGTARNTANAIRVTCMKTVELPIAKMVGAATCVAHGSCIASLVPQGYGLVGLDYIKLNGNASASYWSSSGTVGGAAGNIASNGNITSTSNATINGTVWTLAGATVTGVSYNARKTLPSALVYANGSSAPYNFSINDNAMLGSYYGSGKGDLIIGNNAVVTSAGGNFVVHHVSFAATAKVTFTGDTTIYFWGDVTLSGQTATNANAPKRLKLVGISGPKGETPGKITISGGTSLYATIYAPQSDITLSGSGAIYGSVVGKTITMTGSSDIYYDLSAVGGEGPVQVVR